MTSRSEKLAAKMARLETARGDTPPAGSASGSIDEMTAALATTDRAPVDPAGAIEQLAIPGVGPTVDAPTVDQETRRSGRPPVRNDPQAIARRERDAARRARAGGAPAPKAAPSTGRRSMRDRLADAEAEAAGLRAQVSQLRPDTVLVEQAREALEGTFTIAGSLLGGYVHPTLDIQPQAAKLAELWAVPLAPYMGDLAESMPWIAAGLGTVVVLLPVYQRYQAATSTDAPEATPAEPGKVPETVGVPEVGTHPRPPFNPARDGETITVAPYVKPMGAL